MSQVKFNIGGSVTITPTASDTPDLNITINGVAYAQAWDTDANTTINAWVAAHGQKVADRFGIYSELDTAAIVFYGVKGLSITTDDASNVVTSSATVEVARDLSYVEGISASSATATVLTLNAQATDASITLSFQSEADRIKGEQQVRECVAAAGSQVGPRGQFSIAAKAVVA